jgi:hypothetical protein
LSRCKECIEGDRPLEVLEEEALPGGNLSKCVDRHRREENSFEFCNWKKSPLRDLHRVIEYPEALNKSCLRLRIARRASKHSPSEGEGRKTKSLRGLSVE